MAVRPLPFLQRRRAAAASVGGHCALFALLAVVSTRSEPPSVESPLILAEIVTAPKPADMPAAPAETIDDRTAGPPSIETVPRERVPEPEPPPAEVEEEASAPPPAQPAPPEQAPPPVEPPPAERLVESAEVPATPTAPLEPPAEATDPALPANAPGRALASYEQHAVRRRLSSWTGQLSADAPDTTLAWRENGQEYTAVLRKAAAADPMGMEQLAVELTTERDGERLVAELRMNRVAFSNFAQFIDRWDPEVEIHDDLIDGRFHSNSEIRVSRDRRVRPVFNGKVTVAAGDVRTEGPGVLNKRTMFPEGIETRVRRIVLPPRAATFEASAVPAERLQRLARDSLITFHADGSYETQPFAGDASAERGALGDDPFYIVGADGVALHVRGTVNGKVLVYSPAQIIIVDDLRYADDPRLPGASDYLGLVAERTVEIDKPAVTGTGDLEVHASIYARSRFLIRDYRSPRSGTLRIFGSVAAGSVSATEPRFATRIEFDDRLTKMRAPGFPLSDRYELDETAGEWRVIDAAAAN